MDFKHCDDYIDDETQPECLRMALAYMRLPASDFIEITNGPQLYAEYKGTGCQVKVVFASRLGDVGIGGQNAESYSERVSLSSLLNFSDEPLDLPWFNFNPFRASSKRRVAFR
jgi:hypothetical protein